MTIERTTRAPYSRSVAGRRRAPTKPDAPHDLLVKGLTSADVAALDAIVDKRNAALAAQGASTSRNAFIVASLRDIIAREGKA